MAKMNEIGTFVCDEEEGEWWACRLDFDALKIGRHGLEDFAGLMVFDLVVDQDLDFRD